MGVIDDDYTHANFKAQDLYAFAYLMTIIRPRIDRL